MTRQRTNAIDMAQLLLHLPASANAPAQAARPIGWLSQFGDNLRVSFERDYIDDPDRPTLSQLYRGESDADTQAILSAINDERVMRIGKLPSFFSNLLPEGVNRERLAEQRGTSVDDELDLLAAAGHDLSGALEVVPAYNVPTSVLQLHTTKNLETVQPNAVAAPLPDGFSVDGFQTKFSMVHDGRRYVVRSGSAAGDFIAKLPSIRYPDIAANEGACYRLAQAVGVQVADAQVRPISELDVPANVKAKFKEFLLVRRFDRYRRVDGTSGRIHFEELTQALGHDSGQKYRELHNAMRALLVILKSSDAAGPADFDDFFRRWTVYALLGNTDAHAKNWGLLYADGIHPTLAPAYDIVCVAAYFDAAQPDALSQNRAMDASLRAWNEDQAEAVARSAGLLQIQRFRRIVRNTRLQSAALWPDLLKSAPTLVRKTITERLRVLAPSASP